MRLAVWLTRRQIRAVAAVIEAKGLSAGLSDDDAARAFEALEVFKQVEIDDPPPKHGPKCPEPECGHSLKGHRHNMVLGTVCQVSGCRCGQAKRQQKREQRRELK